MSPADGNAIRAQPASVSIACAYGCETLIFHVFRYNIRPADGRAVFAQSTSIAPTSSAYRFERFIARRRRYIPWIQAPADRPIVVTQPASVCSSAAYGDKTLVIRWLHYSPPTYSDSIRAKTASMLLTCAYGDKAFTSRRFTSISISPSPAAPSPSPAGNSAILVQSTNMVFIRR